MIKLVVMCYCFWMAYSYGMYSDFTFVFTGCQMPTGSDKQHINHNINILHLYFLNFFVSRREKRSVELMMKNQGIP